MSASLSLRQLEEFDPHAKGSGSERRFLCPLCGEGKPKDAAHRSLGANTQSGFWLCHRCGEKGKLAEWRSEEAAKPESPKVRARRGLRQSFSLNAPEHSAPSLHPPSAHISTSDSPPDRSEHPSPVSFASPRPVTAGEPVTQNPVAPSPVWRQALRDLLPLPGSPAARYLLTRGISEEVAAAAGARFSPSWFGRPAVVFPIRDAQGALVAAQGRYLQDGSGSGPKARTAGDKKAGLFITAGLWDAVGRGAPIVVCEAPIDALSLALCGYPALALCGKDGWPSWLVLKCSFHKVALAFDADEAGDAGAEKLHNALFSLGARPFRMRPEGAKDWNQLLIEQGREHLEEFLALRLL